jgi:hypothetical protein
MKTTLLTIALTAASLPFTFAAQTAPAKPATPAAQSSTAASKPAAKKRRKSSKKSTTKASDGAAVKK